MGPQKSGGAPLQTKVGFFSKQGNVSLNPKDLKALTFVGEPSTRACSYTTPQQLTLYLGCTLQN